MIRLIRRDGDFPPGGYPFTDGKTNHHFDGLDAGGFHDQVRRIVAHRLANAPLYANGTAFDFEAVAMELERYQCLRLGNDPRFCWDGISVHTTSSVAVSPSPTAPTCPACKTVMTERYCPGCSGKKLIGWLCTKCKTILDK